MPRGGIETMGFAKPCLMLISCPGDGGMLDTAVVYAHKAANVLPRPQGRRMRLIAFSLMELGFYLTETSNLLIFYKLSFLDVHFTREPPTSCR
jgi:hypothetical protein